MQQGVRIENFEAHAIIVLLSMNYQRFSSPAAYFLIVGRITKGAHCNDTRSDSSSFASFLFSAFSLVSVMVPKHCTDFDSKNGTASSIRIVSTKQSCEK